MGILELGPISYRWVASYSEVMHWADFLLRSRGDVLRSMALYLLQVVLSPTDLTNPPGLPLASSGYIHPPKQYRQAYSGPELLAGCCLVGSDYLALLLTLQSKYLDRYFV